MGYRLLNNPPGRVDPPHPNKTTHKTSGGSSINTANETMTTTANEIYLKAEEINDYQQTFRDMLNRLESESKAQGEDNHCQVVMQLNPQTDGSQWKMFIYYTDNGHFCYSYQDQNLMDTMTYPGIDLEQMIALMLEDMHAVDGIEWIALDF